MSCLAEISSRRSVAAVAVGLGLLLASTSAEARYTGKDALGLIKLALSSCKKPLEAQKQAATAAEDSYPSALVAQRRDGELEISITQLGSGVGGQHWMATWLIDSKRCRAIGVTAQPRDGQLSWALRFVQDRRRAPTGAERKRLLRVAGYAIGKRGAEFAAAALLSAPHRCGKLQGKDGKRGWSLSRPLVRRQGAYRGKPRGSALTAYLRGRRAVAVSFVRKPARVKRYGRYELYLGTLGGRTRDQALAIYDRKRKRHRWVVQTRACTSGRLTWLGRRGDLVLARARPTHPVWRSGRGDSLLFVSLKRAQAYRLLLPASRTLEVKLADAGIELRGGAKAGSQPAKPTLVSWGVVGKALGLPHLAQGKKGK